MCARLLCCCCLCGRREPRGASKEVCSLSPLAQPGPGNSSGSKVEAAVYPAASDYTTVSMPPSQPPIPRAAFEEDQRTPALPTIVRDGFEPALKPPPPPPPLLQQSLKSSMKTKRSNDGVGQTRRSVQWTDEQGKELTQTKEFEMSDSDDSYEDERNLSPDCMCVIQ